MSVGEVVWVELSVGEVGWVELSVGEVGWVELSVGEVGGSEHDAVMLPTCSDSKTGESIVSTPDLLSSFPSVCKNVAVASENESSELTEICVGTELSTLLFNVSSVTFFVMSEVVPVSTVVVVVLVVVIVIGVVVSVVATKRAPAPFVGRGVRISGLEKCLESCPTVSLTVLTPVATRLAAEEAAYAAVSLRVVAPVAFTLLLLLVVVQVVVVGFRTLLPSPATLAGVTVTASSSS